MLNILINYRNGGRECCSYWLTNHNRFESLEDLFKEALLRNFCIITTLLVIQTKTRIDCRSICASIQNCDTFTWSNQNLKCLLKKHLNNRNQYGFDLGTLSSNLTLFLQKKPHFDTQAHNFTACSILIM